MTHTYSIRDLEREASTGVVTKVLWKLTTIEGNTRAKSYNDEFLVTGSASDEGFISWDSLTEADVLGWVDTHVDKSAIELSMENHLNNNPLNGTVKGLTW